MEIVANVLFVLLFLVIIVPGIGSIIYMVVDLLFGY